MSDSMIERIAEAIWYAQHASPGTFERAWKGDATRRHWSSYARAVLAAMREPTEEMRHAGFVCGPDASPGEVYEAMIDEALRG